MSGRAAVGSVTVRPADEADAPAIAAVHVSAWRTAYRRLLPDEVLDQLSVEAIELARERGAARIELGTGEDDAAARALYERLGFSNRGGRREGPVNYFYELEL